MRTDGRSAMKWAETYVSWRPYVLSVMRIMTGLLFLQYGMAKLLKFPAVPLFKDVTLFSLLGLAGTIELVGGVLLCILLLVVRRRRALESRRSAKNRRRRTRRWRPTATASLICPEFGRDCWLIVRGSCDRFFSPRDQRVDLVDGHERAAFYCDARH